MQNILIGYSICSTLVWIFLALLLYKKPTTKNEIDNLKQKNKRNRGSNIDNQITANIEPKSGKTRKELKQAKKDLRKSTK